MTLALGIDIGGTKTAVGAVDGHGRVLARREAPTPAAEGPAAVLANAIRLSREVIAVVARPGDGSGARPDTVVAVGVGAAGVIDPGARVVVSATDTLPGWGGTEIGETLERALGLPVVVENDVHAHAMGEAVFGAGRGHGHVLVVAAGTGIGGALVVDGRVLRGSGHVAGHYGHLPAEEAAGLPCTCGRIGHVEMIAAGPAIHAAYQRVGGSAGTDGTHDGDDGVDTRAIDTRAVFALADAGDARAARIIETAARALGRTIGGLVNALDPDVIVVGGGLAQTGERWWGPLRTGIDEETVPAASGRPALPAELGGDAAIIGAALVALTQHTRTTRHTDTNHHTDTTHRIGDDVSGSGGTA